jgi:4-alpha-glucanotransferase
VDELTALRALAKAVGVHTHYTDGLGKPVTVAPETLVRVCAAVGAQITRPADAAEALLAYHATSKAGVVPPVLVAWDGVLSPIVIPEDGPIQARLLLEGGAGAPLEHVGGTLRIKGPLPHGYHGLTLEASAIISAPVQAYRRPGIRHSWGVGTQLPALRSRRSRSVGDLRDLESLCRWVRQGGGDLVTVLPLLPTFNTDWPEPSPYSPVSRLFWSELILDLGEAHRPVPPPSTLDVTAADAEVKAALAALPVPDLSLMDEELFHYARFRGAQARLGRNWRDWPPLARAGTLEPQHVDADVERFHLVAQTIARGQLLELRKRLDRDGFRLGLDLAVGIHPDGYDAWSRQSLFAGGMAVGAPPDQGFPSGQDWGFSPVLPAASRQEGHRYVAASIAHQMELAGVLRVDHIMAWTRLYWIPHGLGLHEGTYVTYPADELFAILTLESERHRCEVVGENLGTVPPEIDQALPRHRIWGMYLAEFQAASDLEFTPPTAADMALIGTHDTPTFAGWLTASDIPERIRHGLLAPETEADVRAERARAVERLVTLLGRSADEPEALLTALLEWLGRSDSPLVVPWLEDLWLEETGVNLPGTRSSERPNWQRPMCRLLDDLMTDPLIHGHLSVLQAARAAAPMPPATPLT